MVLSKSGWSGSSGKRTIKSMTLDTLIPADEISLETSGVIRVGHGRGVLIRPVDPDRQAPFIVTAAHCLPKLPPFIGGIMYDEEKTFMAVAGPLDREPTITAESLFVDPISDVAVLGPPDDQGMVKAFKAYKAFVKKRKTYRLAIE